MSDSGDGAGGGAANKQTPHTQNLISFTMNSQPAPEFQLCFPAASASAEGKECVWAVKQGAVCKFLRSANASLNHSCSKFHNAAFTKAAIYILISLMVFLKV